MWWKISSLLGLVSGAYGLWNQNWLWIIVGLVLLGLGHGFMFKSCCNAEAKPAARKKRR